MFSRTGEIHEIAVTPPLQAIPGHLQHTPRLAGHFTDSSMQASPSANTLPAMMLCTDSHCLHHEAPGHEMCSGPWTVATTTAAAL